MPLRSIKPPPGARLWRGLPRTRDLVGYWPFWEGGGSAAAEITDPSGAASSFFSGSTPPAWIGSPIGHAVQFAGGSSGSGTAAATGALADLGAFTISGWIRADSSNGAIVYKSDNNTSNGWFVYLSGGSLTFKKVWGTFDTRLSCATPAQGTWFHFAITYTGIQATSGVTLWINGVAQTGTNSQNGSGAGVSDIAQPIWFAKGDGGTGSAACSIASIAIWRRLLSDVEIQRDFAEPFGLFAPGRGLASSNTLIFGRGTAALGGVSGIAGSARSLALGSFAAGGFGTPGATIAFGGSGGAGLSGFGLPLGVTFFPGANGSLSLSSWGAAGAIAGTQANGGATLSSTSIAGAVANLASKGSGFEIAATGKSGATGLLLASGSWLLASRASGSLALQGFASGSLSLSSGALAAGSASSKACGTAALGCVGRPSGSAAIAAGGGGVLGSRGLVFGNGPLAGLTGFCGTGVSPVSGSLHLATAPEGCGFDLSGSGHASGSGRLFATGSLLELATRPTSGQSIGTIAAGGGAGLGAFGPIGTVTTYGFLRGLGTIAAAARGSISGTIPVAGSSGLEFQARGISQAVAVLTASGSATHSGSAAISGKLRLLASGSWLLASTGKLNGSLGLVASGSWLLGSSGRINASFPLAGSGGLVCSAGFSPYAIARLQSSASMTLGATGASRGTGKLSGSALVAVGDAGHLTANAIVTAAGTILLSSRSTIAARGVLAGTSGTAVSAVSRSIRDDGLPELEAFAAIDSLLSLSIASDALLSLTIVSGVDPLGATMVLYENSDNLIRLTGLQNTRATPPTLINTATATCAVTDVITGIVVGTCTLTQDAGVDGQYTGTLLASVGLVAGKRYWVVVTVAVGGATLSVENTIICSDYTGQ